MPISVNVLRSAAGRAAGPAIRSLREARSQSAKTAFLCHSHHDTDLARGLVTLLTEAGWRIYIDWADAEMPETPDRETAERIQQKIVELDFFLFLATANSMASRWCPWEIGYADGKKAVDRILLVRTTDGGRTHGNEYLQIYRHLDISNQDQLAVWRPGQTQGGILVKNL
jgi:hypothetical protein